MLRQPGIILKIREKSVVFLLWYANWSAFAAKRPLKLLCLVAQVPHISRTNTHGALWLNLDAESPPDLHQMTTSGLG